MPSARTAGFGERSAPFALKYRAVHQAAGMLMVRSNCTIDEAMTQLRRQAAEKRWPVERVAHQIIKQRERSGEA